MTLNSIFQGSCFLTTGDTRVISSQSFYGALPCTVYYDMIESQRHETCKHQLLRWANTIWIWR